MSAPLTKRSTDHSDSETFSFSFFCDICGKEWRSPAVSLTEGGFTSIEHEEARQLLWSQEHRVAFEQANLEAHLQFCLCLKCGRRVCDDCFSLEVCKECAQG